MNTYTYIYTLHAPIVVKLHWRERDWLFFFPEGIKKLFRSHISTLHLLQRYGLRRSQKESRRRNVSARCYPFGTSTRFLEIGTWVLFVLGRVSVCGTAGALLLLSALLCSRSGQNPMLYFQGMMSKCKYWVWRRRRSVSISHSHLILLSFPSSHISGMVLGLACICIPQQFAFALPCVDCILYLVWTLEFLSWAVFVREDDGGVSYLYLSLHSIFHRIVDLREGVKPEPSLEPLLPSLPAQVMPVSCRCQSFSLSPFLSTALLQE